MGSMQYLNAKYRVGAPTPVCPEGAGQGLAAPEDGIAVVMDALNSMANVVTNQCFDHPDALTQDNITAYALALVRLRECASMAGFERLTNACDALAVTVSRLIEDRNCASSERCAALRRFVVHAQAMIQMPASSAMRHLAVPATRTLGTINTINAAVP